MGLSLWLLVLVGVQGVMMAMDIPDRTSIKTCDECLRSSGWNWCQDPVSDGRCNFQAVHSDDYCENNKSKMVLKKRSIELPWRVQQENRLPVNATLGEDIKVKLVFDTAARKHVNIIKTQFTHDFKTIISEKSSGETYLTTTVPDNFCYTSNTTTRSADIVVEVDGTKATVHIDVPCACACSLHAGTEKSAMCNHRGIYTCGVCVCDDKWAGEDCGTCKDKSRGDINAELTKDEKECYGNGRMECDECECETEGPGSQYFNKHNYCASLCDLTQNCENCLSSDALGPCGLDRFQYGCPGNLIMRAYNESVLNDTDDMNRKFWVSCSVIEYEYVTMQWNGETHIMVKTNGGSSAGYQGAGVSVTVPVILGVVAVLAAVAAAAAYMVFKNHTPALPLNDSHYQSIGAGEHTGENPLYKDPVSNFTNPTFGKPEC